MAVFEVYSGIEFGRPERNAGETVGHGKTPHGAALRLSVEMRTHTHKIRHGAALPPVATMRGGRCATSPRLKFFWGGRVFYRTIHAAGMKERKGEMDKRAKDFSPLREIGCVDSFSTDRFIPYR